MTPPRLKRPALRYHGGKWLLAPWILEHFPPHDIYVEAYGGGMSVLLRKPRSPSEIYNDLCGEVVNLFQMARERGPELCQLLELTPFSRDELERAYDRTEDPLERARRTLVRSWQGHGGEGTCGRHRTGFRSNVKARYTLPAQDWRRFPPAFIQVVERVQGVTIENRPAVRVMKGHDTRRTLHYADPPYLEETRACLRGYNFEMTDDDHEELADELHSLRGPVILSGYRSRLYDRLYRRWRRVERRALTDGAHERIECLWLSPNV